MDPASPSTSLRIDAVFVYNDPRDWGLDAQIIKDVLLSERGILGTFSPKVEPQLRFEKKASTDHENCAEW